ncbi:MAG TPA: hypothetical protein VK131_12305 [Candidatus Acidoferrales bacterium]|nr:hypothetical protein [Candidatus Acidoferrales bacterium]
MATDLTISMEDKPGTLAAAAEQLGHAGVNIEGICGYPSGGRGQGHILVEDAAKARQALEAAGVRVEQERDVIVVERPDRPGELGKLSRQLANAGINIDLIYLATRTRIVIGTPDLAKARQVLGA